jgi:hypothetical protein
MVLAWTLTHWVRDCDVIGSKFNIIVTKTIVNEALL